MNAGLDAGLGANHVLTISNINLYFIFWPAKLFDFKEMSGLFGIICFLFVSGDQLKNNLPDAQPTGIRKGKLTLKSS